MNELWVVDLGLRRYGEALVIQREVARRRITGEIPEDVLLLVEHPPVITLGRSAKGQNLLASPALLEARGVELFEVERGGDVTFHGPGQLVGYPIVDLKRHRKDLHWYLRSVEEALIGALGAYGVPAGRVEGYTGVWVGDVILSEAKDLANSRQGQVLRSAQDDKPRKIASIGVHARDWVTWHGFALNVATDLSYFDLMVPCGIAEVKMTSLAREVGGAAPGLREVGSLVVAEFGRLLALGPVERGVEALGAPLEPLWTSGGARG